MIDVFSKIFMLKYSDKRQCTTDVAKVFCVICMDIITKLIHASLR